MEPTPIAFWIAAGVVGAISLWTIVGTIVRVARGKNRPWSFDVIAALLFHGGTAVLALYLAHLAQQQPPAAGG